jgi:hypothetical protein
MSKLPTSRLPVTPSKTTSAPKLGLRPPQSSSNVTTPLQQASPTGGDVSNHVFAIGDRVTANGKSGAVAFIGSTKFADGKCQSTRFCIQINHNSNRHRRMDRCYS